MNPQHKSKNIDSDIAPRSPSRRQFVTAAGAVGTACHT